MANTDSGFGVKNMLLTSAKENKKNRQSKCDKILNNCWIWMLEILDLLYYNFYFFIFWKF